MLVKWIVLSFFSCVVAQKSFANTKFDLPSDLPVEDLPAISPSRDDKPKQVLAAQKHHKTPKTTKKPVPSTTPAPVTLPPVAFTTMTLPTFTFPTMPTLPPFGFSTPAPFPSSSIPPVPTPPPVVPAVPQFVPPPPPAQPQIPVQVPSSTIIHPQNVIPAQGSRQIELVPANQYRDRAELWFREDFDAKECISNPENVAEKFLQKFPKNLLKNNKEIVLAQLLSSRLKECLKKQQENTWNNINERLGGLNLSTSEQNECRTGLIQEQISCLNVQSYACQFIEPKYNFRLVPTRIIIQEARLAEDGVDKCRKANKLIKKQNNH